MTERAEQHNPYLLADGTGQWIVGTPTGRIIVAGLFEADARRIAIAIRAAVKAERERLLDMLREPSEAMVDRLAREKAERVMAHYGFPSLFDEYTPDGKASALTEARADMAVIATLIKAEAQPTAGEETGDG